MEQQTERRQDLVATPPQQQPRGKKDRQCSRLRHQTYPLSSREGVEGSPVAVVVETKGPGCAISLHVRDLLVYDYREALRPPTRFLPIEEEEYEEES